MGTRALRLLTEPRPIEVETDDDGTPIAVTLNGRRHKVDCIREEWLIQDQWWTEEPVVRHCVDLVLRNGRQLETYRLPHGWAMSRNPSPERPRSNAEEPEEAPSRRLHPAPDWGAG